MSSGVTMASTYGAPVSAFGSEEGGMVAQSPHASFRSQSKLREILRDQSRREEKNQHIHGQTSPPQNAHLGPQEPVSPSSLSASTSSAAVQSLQMAGQGKDRIRRPSLVSSVSAAVMGTTDNHRQRRETLPTSKTASRLDATAMASTYASGGPSTSSGVGAASLSTRQPAATPAVQRQRSLRRSHEREREQKEAHLSTSPSNDAHHLTIATPPARMARAQSSGANLSGGVDLKVVILGAQGVGKTSLVHRYTSGHFSASAVPSTIGASFLTKKLLVDGVKVRLQLWDTAGQERFRSMAPMYYRGANAAVIVYDITNGHTFDDVKTWIDELRQNVQSDLVIHIVGSKVDLAPYERQVDLDFARRAIAQWSSPEPEPTEVQAVTTSPPSLFGGRRGTGQTPPSPPSHLTTLPLSSPNNANLTASPPSGSRLPGLTTISALAKSSRMMDRQESLTQEGDRISNPSTVSSQGVAAYGGNARDWDFIEVSEVSAKDNEGIEDVFVGIATRLVERREELEAQAAARKRRERDSVFLSEEYAPAGLGADRTNNAAASWCCTS